MEWWQLFLMWTGAVWWALIVLLTLSLFIAGIRRRRNGPEPLEIDLTDSDIKPGMPGSGYVWLMGTRDGRPPMRVPQDMFEEAAELLEHEDIDELERTIKPWTYTVTLQGIKRAMAIAQEEDDIEYALMLWLGHGIQMPDEDYD